MPSYRDTILATSGLLSYYRLGEGSAVPAVDEKGRANGVYGGSGNTYAVTGLLFGDANTAVTFSGAGFVDISDTGLPTGAAPRTLEAWIKTSSAAISNAGIVGYGTQVNTQDFEMRNISGQFGFQVRPNSYIFGGSIADNVRHHVLLAYDGTNALGFLDGTQIGSQAVTPATVLAGATGLEIGVWSGFFTGTVDEIAVYNRALSAYEVRAHYNASGIMGTTVWTLGSRF
jgi:hypothetical protein